MFGITHEQDTKQEPTWIQGFEVEEREISNPLKQRLKQRRRYKHAYSDIWKSITGPTTSILNITLQF